MLARRPDGREPESDYSGRIGAAAIPNAGGAVNADRSLRPSLPYTPSYEVCPACPVPRTRFGHHLYHIPLLRSPTTTPEPLPLPPLCPRLHCTMPCYGTPRVRVLECPPLGRPSLIKLVLVNIKRIVCTPLLHKVGHFALQAQQRPRACSRAPGSPPPAENMNLGSILGLGCLCRPFPAGFTNLGGGRQPRSIGWTVHVDCQRGQKKSRHFGY
jgi:hypothetical protein